MAKLSKKTLRKVLWRTQGCQFAHNYERMQSTSFTYGFAPILEELYKDRPKEERIAAMKRHLEYFNTHPLAIPFIMGISAAVEEASDEEHKESVVAIKTGLMGPFAGLGDSMLNLTWFPIAGSIGASMAVSNGSIIGPIVMFLMINIVYWPLKYYGLHKGYEKGVSMIESEEGSEGLKLFDRVSNFANVLGVVVVSGLLTSTIKISTGLEIKSGEGVLKIQEQLDKVMPSLLPMLLTVLCYILLKKGQGKHAALVILGLLLLCMLLSIPKILV